jgi:two-component system chemotaxis response regulator CheV
MNDRRSTILEREPQEFEIVEFSIYDGETPTFYGLIVAKVCGIIQKPKLKPIVNTPRYLAGMITVQKKVLPVIDLGIILDQPSSQVPDRIIVLEFKRVVIGLLVNSISRIYPYAWEKIEPPRRITAGSYIAGRIRIDNHIIIILDLDRIIAEIYQDGVVKALDTHETPAYDDSGNKVLLTDDAALFRLKV